MSAHDPNCPTPEETAGDYVEDEPHQHDPGCSYRAECQTCDWRGNWGSHDNAFYTGYDHSHEGASVGHKVKSVHEGEEEEGA